MPDNKVLKSIYNTLKNNDSFQQAKSYEEFAAKMKNPGYNNQIFSLYRKNGGQGTLDKWRAATGYTVPKKAVSKPVVTPKATQVASNSRPQRSRLVEQAMQSIGFNDGIDVNDTDVRAPFKPEKVNLSAKPQYDYEPTRERITVDEGGREVKEARKISDDYKLATSGKFTPAKQQIVDEKGNVVKENTIYPIQPQEVEYSQQMQAFDKQMKAEQAQQEKQLADAKKEATKDYNKAIKGSVGKELNEFNKLSTFQKFALGFGNLNPNGIMDSMYRRAEQTEGARNAQARLDMLDEAQNIIREVKAEKTDKSGIVGFFQGAGRGLAQKAASTKTWSFGGRDTNESLQLLGAVMAYDNGVATDEQKKLLEVAALKMGITSKYEDQLGRGYKAGQVTGESLPFMVEMMMNPISGLGKGASKGLGKYLVKKYGKQTIEKNMKKYIGAKIATRVGADIFAGYGMALTSSAAHTAADVAQNMTGDIQNGIDEKGNTVYAGHTKGDSFGKALVKGATRQAIENQSELVGEYELFEPIKKYLGKWVGKAVGKVDNVLAGTKAEPFYNTARNFVTELSKNEGIKTFSKNIKEFQSKTKWNGTLGEYFEEVVGNVENAISVGDNDFGTEKGKGVFNLSDNIDTFLGVSLMGGAFAGAKTLGYAGYKLRGGAKGKAQRAMDDIDAKLNSLHGDNWSIIKKSIDLAKDDGIALNDILTDVMTSKMSKDEKNLVLNYAKNQQIKRGAEMADFKPRTANIKRSEKDGKFGVQWLDKNGNEIGSRSFDSKERADAYEQELRDEQVHNDMRNMYDTATGINMRDAANAYNPEDENWRENIAQKAKENEEKTKAAIAKFEADNGMKAGDVKRILNKEAWELTDKEQSVVPALNSLLKDLAYPTNVVNEEHFEEEGAAMADNAGFENNTPNVDVAQAARQEYEAAKAAYEKALNNNEILKDEVQSRLNKGMKPADILMDLEGFTDEELDTVSRFFNADAKFNGFMNQTQKNIQNAVGEKVDEHTFRGTINGVPDTKNRVEISNGKETFTLIGGELTTDDNGNVVDRGKTNLVVARNSDGDLVLLPSTDKLTILPNSQTLEDFGNQLYQELGANATEAIDPNNDLVQSQAEAAQEQVTGNPAEEAPQEEAVPVNEEETPANENDSPVSEGEQVEGEEAPTDEQQPSSEPQQEKPVIPTDKDGVKLYENGVDAGDALGDMLENGDNVDEIADAAIAEADEAINAINSKTTKSRKDLVERKKHEQIKKYYEDLKSNHTHVDLGNGYSSELYGDNRGFILKDGKIIYDSEGKYAPVPTEDEINALMPEESNGANNAATDAETGHMNSEESINNEVEDNNETENDLISLYLKDAQAAIKKAVEKYGNYIDADFSHANDVKELVSMFFGKKRFLAWKSYGNKRGLEAELGWTRKIGGDTQFIETMLAKNGEGMSIDEFVHMIWESSENGGRFDDQEIRNAVLNIISSAQSKADIFAYMFKSRIAAAEKAMEAEERAAENNAEYDYDYVPEDYVPDGIFPDEMNGEIYDLINNDNEQEGNDNDVSVDETDVTRDERSDADSSGEEDRSAEPAVHDTNGQVEPDRGREEKGKSVPSSVPGDTLDDATSPAGGTSNVQERGKSVEDKETTGDKMEPVGDYSFIENNEPVEYKGDGKRHSIISVVHSGEQVSATQFSKPSLEKVYITDNKGGMIEAKPEDLTPYKDKSNPVETAKAIAEERKQEKAKSEEKTQAKKKVAHKLVSDERYEELKKRMREKLYGQMNMGIDPEILTIGAEMAVYHIEAGAIKFADYAKNMIEDLGEAIRPYLKSFYNAVRDMPEAQDFSKKMDSYADVAEFNVLTFDQKEAKTVNDNKKENNGTEKGVSLQQEGDLFAQPENRVDLQGDSKEYADRNKKLDEFREEVHKKLRKASMFGEEHQPLSKYKQIAKEIGIEDITDTDLQELIEAELVDLAREYANMEGWADKEKFDVILSLYKAQPSLNARDNDRINLQQYSTPAPMAFLMSLFLTKGKDIKSGLEPSAGNGMLTIGLPKDAMHVNDIDEMRISNLQRQGFGTVTSQDGTQPFEQKAYDVVVTNPPFGSIDAREYDGYSVSGLEHAMAINALDSMKDDGRAAIIIGGNTEYNSNGSIKGKDKQFLNYLYSHYNVVDVINIDGKALYSKQGTGYNVRMILIDGRKANDNSFAPVEKNARAEQVKSYDELFNRVNNEILRDQREQRDTSDGVLNTESRVNGRASFNGDAGVSNEKGVRNVRGENSTGEHQLPTGNKPSVQRSGESTKSTEGRAAEQQGHTGVESRPSVHDERRTEPTEPSRSETLSSENRRREVVNGGSDVKRSVGSSVDSGTRLSVEQQKRELGAEKVPYRQKSRNPFSLQSQMPAEQADTVEQALNSIGDVDEYLVNELGYSSVDDLHHGSQSPENHGGLAAEQIDSVALAIHQMKNGDAFIIGDQTGIGKGRQGAALIRWGVKQGACPIYFTAKPELFSGVYRDLKDIGSGELRPFILASDKVKARITERIDGKDVVIYDLPTDKEQKRVIDYINEHGTLPEEYDFMITTYSQVGNGTMEYENGTKKARSYGGKKSVTKADLNGQKKRDAIERLSGESIVIMDESHLAGGESARGNYLQYISTKAKGITYISATFAKRPDNMPLYSLRTAISKAGVKISELIDAVKQGGTTFQEILSKALTEAGQMIRRERNMAGVTVDWRGIEDEEIVERQREQYDKIIGLFNDIISFQKKYVDPIIDHLNDEAAFRQGSVDHTPGTRDMGINNTPFASKTFNMVKQVLLSLKAEEGAKFAVECLKRGEKPVICVENTNEGAADRATANSDKDMQMPDLSTNLLEGLKGVLRIQKKDANNDSENTSIPLERLSPEGQQRYYEIEDAIRNSSTGLSLSPIDVIKNHIRQAGYTVAELTGRSKEFVYNDDGTVKRVNREDKDNKKNASDFNNGIIDAVIINKSAGTGIDLHAGMKFANTNQRHMIIVQAQSDVNDEVQMRGRTDRTGQKQHSKYTYIVSQIPSEQRLLMMLKAKLRSLDANTTSSQKSKFNEMQVQDIINKYGDDIVISYLAEHPDIADKLCNPLKWEDDYNTLTQEELISKAQKSGEQGKTASKVLGRMALLKVNEQEQMLNDISQMYQTEIDRLNEMGENDLEITEMPLEAKTLKKTVWEEGVEPNGKNPFADNSYVEEVEMNVLKKPMKGAEVKKAQDGLLKGKSWGEYKQSVLDSVNKWAEEKKEAARKTVTERAEKKANAEKEKYYKGAKKSQKDNGMTDAEIENNSQYQYKHIYDEEMSKLDNLLNSIDRQKEAFVNALETFSTDGVYAIPSDIYDLGELTFTPTFGKLIDVKISSNFSTAASVLSFATLDGRRKITFPIIGLVKQTNGSKTNIIPQIIQQTAQVRGGIFGSNAANTLKVLEQNAENWDKLTSTTTRKKGYIITGNLLKALVSTREQMLGGKLISYTTSDGEIKQGILMSDKFKPEALTSKKPISSAKEELKYPRDIVKSADGEVSISVTYDYDYDNRGYNTLSLSVPGSTKKGSKYFNDEKLLSLMNGQFVGKSKMKAEFDRSKLDEVMSRLDELGVTVNEDIKADNETSYRDTDSFADAINQQRMVREAAKKAMPNTKVVDEQGNPKVVYHFTDARDIKVFDHEHGSGKHGDVLGKRFYFTPNANGQEVEYGKNMIPVYLNIENPYNASEGLSEDFINKHDTTLQELFGKEYKDNSYVMEKLTSPRGLVDLEGAYKENVVERLGFDGIYYGGGWMDDEQWAVSNPNQIKSAKAFVFDNNGGFIPVGERFNFANDDIRYRDEGAESRREENKAVQKSVSDTIRNLNAGKSVIQVRSIEDAPKDVRQHINEMHEQGKKVHGWYRNGKVYLFMPDITSRHEAVITILHELVGHKGLRDVFGKVGYQNIMRALWLNGPKEMREWVLDHIDTRGWDFYKAMDEYLAAQAEKGGNLGFWQNIRRILTDVLNKLGINVDLNIYDTKYLLWASKNQIKEGNPISIAKRNALLRKFGAQDVSAVTVDNRVYDNSNLSKEELDKFSEDEKIGENDTPIAMSAKAFYHDQLKRASFVWNEAYADYMASLKAMQEAIGGKEIPDSQNAYMAENAMSSRNQQEGNQFIKDCVEPLQAIINKCIGLMGWKLTDLERYLYVKHGLERNRVFAFRDWINNERKKNIQDVNELSEEEKSAYEKAEQRIWEKYEDGVYESEAERDADLSRALNEVHNLYLDNLQTQWETMRSEIKDKLAKNEITFAEYCKKMDDFINDNIDAEWTAGKNDMSGLSSMYSTDEEENGYDDEELINRVMDVEASMMNDNVKELWERINIATRFAVEKEYASGVISKESRDRALGMFDFYVPLRNFAEETAEDVYQYMNDKGSKSEYVGSTLKRAKGRKSEAKHPIATILAMATNAISRGNRNEMKQRFARLIRANYDVDDKDRLVTEHDVWIVNTANENESDNWETAYPNLLDDNGEPLTDTDEIAERIAQFNNMLAEKKRQGKARKVSESGNIPYHVLSDKDKAEHIVEVRFAGKPHMFIVNGNPRAAQAINGKLNPSAGAYKLFSAINGMMSAAMTSYSLTFAMRNATRDFEYFYSSLNAKEGSSYANAAVDYYKELGTHFVKNRNVADKKKDKVMPLIHVLFRKYKAGTLNEENEIEKDFKDFVDNGGVTGFTQMKNVDDWYKELNKVVKKLNANGAQKALNKASDALDTIGSFVDGINEGIENMARFATYRASRHKAGRSVLRSVSDAKDVTVNFNRKGAGAKTAKYAHTTNAKIAGHSAQFFRGTKLFFNASMQAIMNAYRVAKNHPIKFIRNIAAIPFAIGVAAPLINAALFAMLGGDGDDPYADLPEFDRRSNWCIYIGNNSFFKIPISQEMKPFVGLGDLLAGYIYNPNLQSIDKNAIEQIVELMALYSPVDVNTTRYGEDGVLGSFLNLLVPQAVSPIAEVASNTSWTNRPIQKENAFNENAPEYQKAYRNTYPSVVEMSKKWHELWGGDEAKRSQYSIGEVSPAYAQYLTEQYTGGVGKFVASTGDNIVTFAKWLKGEDVDFNVRNLEGVKAFFTQGDDNTILNRKRAKYYKYLDEAKKTDYIMSAYRHEAERGNVLSTAKMYDLGRSNTYKRAKIAEAYGKALSDLDRAQDLAKNNAEKKQLQNTYNQLLMECVEKLDSLNDGGSN